MKMPWLKVPLAVVLTTALPLFVGCRAPGGPEVYLAPGIPFRLRPPREGPALFVTQEVVFRLPGGAEERRSPAPPAGEPEREAGREAAPGPRRLGEPSRPAGTALPRPRQSQPAPRHPWPCAERGHGPAWVCGTLRRHRCRREGWRRLAAVWS